MAEKPKKRPNPTAQVGNYAAPVDTAGMDSEMKKLMGVDKPRGKRKSLWQMLKDAGKQGN